MKKDAVVVLPLILVVLFTMVLPVFAESPKKIPVKVVIRSKIETSSMTETNPGEIQHVDLEWEGNIRLYIPVTSASYISGTYDDEISGVRILDVPGGIEHSNVNEGVFHFHEVWTFGTGNTFEGIAQVKTDGAGFSKYEAHIVLQGSGIFEGQKLILSSTFPPVLPDRAPTYYGDLLIP